MTVAIRLSLVAVLAICAVGTVRADDNEKVKLPDAVTKAWGARFKNAEIVSIKSRDEGFEIKAKDSLNESFKVLYGSDGKIVSEKKHKVSLDHVPSVVLQAAKQWAPGATWLEPASVETKKGGETVYELVADIGGQTAKTHFNGEGKQLDADELPTPKEHESKDHDKQPTTGPRVDHVNRIVHCC